MLESVKSVNLQIGGFLKIAEWIVTIIFTVEYLLRIYVLPKPWKYIFSFFGLVDLLSILPTFISFFLSGANGLMVIRALRLLRVFRIFKLSRYTKEAGLILYALRESQHKLFVFFVAILAIVTILGALMYLVEGEENGFKSIPESIYWAIVTLTTVGYGDIAPHTGLGKLISSFVMLLGYAIIAVPTGIVSVAMRQNPKTISTQVCPNCLSEDNDADAIFCKRCGNRLNEEKQ